MKKIIKLITGISCIIILGGLCFVFAAKDAFTNNKRAMLPKQTAVTSLQAQKHEEPIILYEQRIDNLTNVQVDELWPSNNPRSWIFTGTMDGEISKRYKAWHIKYKSQLAADSDKRGLDDNEDLTIRIKNLNINSSDYKDIRLIIDYLSSHAATSLTKTYSLEVYAVDNHNNKYGPFNVSTFETTGFYMRKSGTKEIYERNFNIITESIKTPNNTKIVELVVKPYGNYPRMRNDGTTFRGDWRGAANTMFEVAGMKIAGYKNSTYQKPDYVKSKNIDIDKTRESIIKRMYDLATVKWSPSVDFHDIRTIGSTTNSIRTTYNAGKVYYGPPYTQRNRVPLEKFASEINHGTLSKPKDLTEIWGADCSSSVSYSISKFIPLHAMYDPTSFMWDRNVTSLLGKLSIDGKESSSADLKKHYNEQAIYEAYSKLQKGDVVATHHKTGTHVRLITGNTHVVRNIGKQIDAIKSYFIITEISSNQTDTTVKNNIGLLVNENDSIIPFLPNQQLTDINDLRDLENQNTNFRINKKITFKEAYDENYVPITLKSYQTGTSEEPYAIIINPNTASNISQGLKGTVCSNYTILSLKFAIKNKVSGEEKTFTDYPNHSSGTLEGVYGNTYSLYYHTPQNIQNYIKEALKNYKGIEIILSVSAGEREDIKVLHLKT